MTGRPAALPGADYRLPERMTDRFTVVAFPEDGGDPVVLDLSGLPVSSELREWFARAIATTTGPSGALRARASFRGAVNVLRRFTRYLASLNNAPTSPDRLRRAHVDGFVLAGGLALHRDLGSLRSLLRHADPPPPEEFWARLAMAATPKSSTEVSAYSGTEYRRIVARCKQQLRPAAARIRAARRDLEAWRGGQESERGALLDHVDRHGDVPRFGNGAPRPVVYQHGGVDALMAALHLTFDDLTAAVVLLICLTGHNLGTIERMTVAHVRSDGDGGDPSAVVNLVKPRRATRSVHMTSAFTDRTPDGRRGGELDTPFGVFSLLVELGAGSRAQAGTDRLLVCYAAKGVRGFRIGLSKSAMGLWSQAARIPADSPADIGSGIDSGVDHSVDHGVDVPALQLQGRRLRRTFLEMYQRPVAHTDRTLADQYLLRDRGNITEYRKVVAEVLEEQVAAARAAGPVPVLTATALATSDPERVADAIGISPHVVADLVAGRLDTALTACTDNHNGPHDEPGSPCTASFLLCLSCPCARATPAHLPVQIHAREQMLARREQMAPTDWARRYGGAIHQLEDIIAQHGPGPVADAREAITDAHAQLVRQLLDGELDYR